MVRRGGRPLTDSALGPWSRSILKPGSLDPDRPSIPNRPLPDSASAPEGRPSGSNHSSKTPGRASVPGRALARDTGGPCWSRWSRALYFSRFGKPSLPLRKASLVQVSRTPNRILKARKAVKKERKKLKYTSQMGLGRRRRSASLLFASPLYQHFQ